MDTFRIRNAVVADVEDLADLFVRSSLSNEEDRELLLKNPGALAFSDVAVREGRTRVITTNGRIVGFATTVTLEGVVEMEALFVDPGWTRRGLGRRLVVDAVAVTRHRGIARIEVTANNHARAFYDNVGFVFDGEVAMPFGSASRMHLDVHPIPFE